MFHKRLADKIKAGFAWSVISEEGERLPAKDNVKDGELMNDNQSHLLSLNVVSPEIEEVRETIPIKETIPGSPWNMERMLNNSERKFQPEFLLKKPEKEESNVKVPPVKRPTAAFRVVMDQVSESGEVSSIELPTELVQSCELLADSVISMSLSVLSAEKPYEAPTKKGEISLDRCRSVEFNFISHELNKTG